jgi:hypothetical protein
MVEANGERGRRLFGAGGAPCRNVCQAMLFKVFQDKDYLNEPVPERCTCTRCGVADGL